MVVEQMDRAELREARVAFAKSVGDPAVESTKIAALFDGLSSELRVALVRSLGRGELRALYRKVEGFAPLALVDSVGPSLRRLRFSPLFWPCGSGASQAGTEAPLRATLRRHRQQRQAHRSRRLRQPGSGTSRCCL